MEASRRAVVLGLGVALTGCSAARSSSADSPTPSATAPKALGADGSAPSGSGPGSPAGPSEGVLPAVSAWRPGPGELVPACKLAAVREVEDAGNGRGTALHVIDAQYGGLLPDSASVLVVSRSWRRVRDQIVPGGHTYDVRLSRTGATWRVTAVHPSRPGAAARSLTAGAHRVLASDRIHLAPAATRDVLSGRIHESVLAALLTVARTHRPSISVLRSGHPIHVFGTTRLSDHPRGRAFDTWAVDGRAVVDPRTPRTLVEDYMHAVAAAGSYNVGGPYLLGPAPQWFSDATHHDHVHAGFAS